MRRLLFVLLLCGCAEKTSKVDMGPADLAPATDPLVAARPYGVRLPSGFEDTKTYPFILVLHGYGGTGFIEDAYFGISNLADQNGAIVAYPDGTVDASGKEFWNATDGCCNLGQLPIDDVAYLTAVIDDVLVRYHADPKKVFVIGHSNGAFMANRLACDVSDRIASVIAFAGAMWNDPSKCKPATPIYVAQIHGDADGTISYDGGQVPSLVPYPSAMTTYDDWSGFEGCTGTMTDPTKIDLEATIPGDETTIIRGTGCKQGGVSELWTMHGADHIPTWSTSFAPTVYSWFYAHAR